MNYISPKEEVLKVKRWPKDIRAAGGVSRMADPTIVEEV
ncbi:chromosome condensation regulator, partial [Bacillus sp. B-TM1]